MAEAGVLPDIDLSAPCAGRPLRIVLLAFYNYESHALRIFHPLLRRRGHDVHSIFFKNYFTYHEPTPRDCDLTVDLIVQLQPDLVGMSVWSTYYELAGRLSQRIKERVNPVIIWGGVHAQTRPRDCLRYADIVCKAEGELVLADLTERLSQGADFTELPGCWVRRGDEVRENPARLLLPALDVLPPVDTVPENKYYLARNYWRDVDKWDRAAAGYDIMMARGCPFQCTFCVHSFARKEFEGLGTYLRRRSVAHVMAELRAIVATRPKLRTIAISDDIFAPPRPWLEEFCAAYKKEIGLPFVINSFPGMVDEHRVGLMRAAGLWCSTMGIQSGSERIRRDCFGRETADEKIIAACRIFARHGVVRNLDFIGDNPYETDDDKRQTVELLHRLPKPFYFNFVSLTYFPGAELTNRALRDGLIAAGDVEDKAQKGYHVWGRTLFRGRSSADLYWDVLYAMAVHGVPGAVIRQLMGARFFRGQIRHFARAMRRVRTAARWKSRVFDALAGRPNLLYQYWADTNRTDVPVEVTANRGGPKAAAGA